MLLEARRAGQELLAQKAVTPHGQFKAWIEENTRVSYRTANKYMKVAQLMGRKNTPQGTFDVGINAFLDAHAESHSKPNAKFSLSEDDALYAKKLHALAQRGVGGGKFGARTPHQGLERARAPSHTSPVNRLRNPYGKATRPQ